MATTTKSRRKTVQAVVTVCKFTESGKPFTIIRPETSLAEFNPVGYPDDYFAQGFNTPLRDATAKFVSHLESLQSPDKVVIGLLADESGSMNGNEAAVVQGINDFVKGMAEVKKVDPNTAGTVLAVITTDGLENASKEISPEALHDLMAKKESEGWTFIFLGAQIDAWDVGRSTLGLSGGVRGQTISYVNTPRGTAAAMASATTDSQNYLSNMANYQTNKVTTGSSMKSVTEDGTELLSNINASQPQPNVTVQNITYNSPYSNIDEALKKAKEKTS